MTFMQDRFWKITIGRKVWIVIAQNKPKIERIRTVTLGEEKADKIIVDEYYAG